MVKCELRDVIHTFAVIEVGLHLIIICTAMDQSPIN